MTRFALVAPEPDLRAGRQAAHGVALPLDEGVALALQRELPSVHGEAAVGKVLPESGQDAVEIRAMSAEHIGPFGDPHRGLGGAVQTARIREEQDRQERLVIVAMTGGAFGEDRARCLEAGMNDHVAKPVRTADFERILARYLPDED